MDIELYERELVGIDLVRLEESPPQERTSLSPL